MHVHLCLFSFLCVCSRCVVVCVQQLEGGFPWWRFCAVFELQCLGDSAVRSICTKNRIHYTCFITTPPCTGLSCNNHPNPTRRNSHLLRIVFIVFVFWSRPVSSSVQLSSGPRPFCAVYHRGFTEALWAAAAAGIRVSGSLQHITALIALLE